MTKKDDDRNFRIVVLEGIIKSHDVFNKRFSWLSLLVITSVKYGIRNDDFSFI